MKVASAQQSKIGSGEKMGKPKLTAICSAESSKPGQNSTEETVIVSPTKKGGSKWSFIAAGVALLVLLVGGGAYFYVDSMTQASVKPSQVNPVALASVQAESPYQVVQRDVQPTVEVVDGGGQAIRKEVLTILEPLLHDIVRLNKQLIEQDRSQKAALRDVADFVKREMVSNDVSLSEQDKSIGRLEKRYQTMLSRLKKLETSQSTVKASKPVQVQAQKKSNTVSVSTTTPKKYFYEIPAEADSGKIDTNYYLFAFTDTGAFIRHSSNQDLVVALKGEVLGECGRVLSVMGGNNPVVVTENCKDIVGI